MSRSDRLEKKFYPPERLHKNYEVCSETSVNESVKRQVIKVLFKNTGSSGYISSIEAKLISVPSNFTKIIRSEVDVNALLTAGKEAWSTCDAKAGIKLKVDTSVTEPVGEWRWSVSFNYNGQAYTIDNVPMQ